VGAGVSLDDVREARERLAGVLRPTPTQVADAVARAVGREVLLKPEHLQRTGSFKIRGAYNRISRLPAGSRVVTASAGNHAQGVALAASLVGCRALVFMPVTVALPKLAATRDYGAEVVLVEGGVDEAIAAAKAADGVFVPPFDDPLVVAGQGTIGLELLDEAPTAGTVVVPVGGGGLIGGIGVALAGSRRLVGVQAEGAAAMVDSLAAGRVVTLDRVATIADGIALRAPSPLTLELVRSHVDEVVTVTDEEISQALLLLLERAKAVVEPAGAAGLAAVLAGKVPGDGPVALVLSGGNVDPILLGRLVEHGLAAAGRHLVLRVELDDRPGSLAALTTELARLGLNVLEVDHQREGGHLPLNRVAVRVALETRDPEHGAEVVETLVRAGYQVRPSD
jgi:threonine dehydratase